MLRRIYIIAFLFSFQVALTAYVNSTLAEKLIGKQYVGLLFGIASLGTLTALSFFPKILNKLGNRKTFLSLVCSTFILLLILSFVPSKIVIGIALALYMIVNTLIYFCLDIFIEHFSASRNVGRIRGLYLMISNIGWVSAPLFSSRLATNNINLVYLGSSIIVLVGIILAWFLIDNYNDKHYVRRSLKETISEIRRRHDIWPIIAINFLLQFFFSWMVIYTPIYLREYLHFDWHVIGIIFSIMLSAFVIIQYPLGRLIDKGVSLRLSLMAGFFIIIGSTVSIPFAGSDILVIGTLLFLTRVGAASIEVSSDTYFFRKTTDGDTHLLSLYRDMNPFAYVVGPLLATSIFFFKVPMPHLFILLGAILATGIFLVSTLQHSTPYEKNARR